LTISYFTSKISNKYSEILDGFYRWWYTTNIVAAVRGVNQGGKGYVKDIR